MPVLKQLGPAQPKKRTERGALSISAPLGDFRHTLHVGRGGDAFGDTSFLTRQGVVRGHGRANSATWGALAAALWVRVPPEAGHRCLANTHPQTPNIMTFGSNYATLLIVHVLQCQETAVQSCL
uniref:CRIB domain-containing protein n=1 Tax=Marmota marmota marmota TaxID=9994 RepID=A0A8C5YQP2_MARMA